MDTEKSKRYTLLWIPESGLFYAGGRFTKGDGDEIGWQRKIPVFRGYARAERAKQRILARWPERRGELIILSFEPEEVKDDQEARAERSVELHERGPRG